MIFSVRSSCIPDLAEAEGLTDKSMMELPAMHLADFDPIQIEILILAQRQGCPEHHESHLIAGTRQHHLTAFL